MGQKLKPQERSKLSRREWKEIDRVFRNDSEETNTDEEAFNIQEYGTLDYLIKEQIRISYNG